MGSDGPGVGPETTCSDSISGDCHHKKETCSRESGQVAGADSFTFEKKKKKKEDEKEGGDEKRRQKKKEREQYNL